MAYRYYNLTNMTSAGNDTTILSFVGEINTTLNYVPTTLILVAIYIVLSLSLISKGFDVIKSVSATSFVGMILAIILFPMNLIAGITLIIFVVLCPLSLFILWVFGGTTT